MSAVHSGLFRIEPQLKKKKVAPFMFSTLDFKNQYEFETFKKPLVAYTVSSIVTLILLSLYPLPSSNRKFAFLFPFCT